MDIAWTIAVLGHAWRKLTSRHTNGHTSTAAALPGYRGRRRPRKIRA